MNEWMKYKSVELGDQFLGGSICSAASPLLRWALFLFGQLSMINLSAIEEMLNYFWKEVSEGGWLVCDNACLCLCLCLLVGRIWRGWGMASSFLCSRVSSSPNWCMALKQFSPHTRPDVPLRLIDRITGGNRARLHLHIGAWLYFDKCLHCNI